MVVDEKQDTSPRVVIVGGGFGGLAAAKALKGAPCRVTVVDRRNHHVFQPLLYQVATAALSPADIASPIRHILSPIKNCHVVLAEPTGVDLAGGRLLLDGMDLPYDWLILAAGATHSYFGHDDWASMAPGLKTIEDATEIRRRILLAFEGAEYEVDEAARRAALTFVIIGGGPTGVEMAGAIKEIAGRSMPADFRNIDTKTTRVVLLEGSERLLASFPPELSERAKHDLERMGVEVRVGKHVTNVTPTGVFLGDEFIPVRTVFWAAGVKASGLSKALGVPLDRSGRVIVGPDLTIPGHANVFVIGDMAAATSANDGKPVPGVAQGAIQMGRYVGLLVKREAKGGTVAARTPFSYTDKGSMATIGLAKAVADIKGMRFGGFIAWVMWGVIHVVSLATFRNRLAVFANWVWSWIFFSSDARLITGDSKPRLRQLSGNPPPPVPALAGDAHG